MESNERGDESEQREQDDDSPGSLSAGGVAGAWVIQAEVVQSEVVERRGEDVAGGPAQRAW